MRGITRDNDCLFCKVYFKLYKAFQHCVNKGKDIFIPMEINESMNDMNRIELPKMKKAFVSLQKLDMFSKMPVSENGSENSKMQVGAVEENEDPSSESISTGSTESNVVCTDDDDLEKKIQAFSIPVKKDAEKSSSKTDNESIKSHSEKGAIIEKARESIKSGKKQTSKPENKTKEKAALKIDTKSSTEPPNAAISNALNVSSGIRKKKESVMKHKIKTDNEKKPQASVPLQDKEQEHHAVPAKLSNVNTPIDCSLDHNLRNGRGDKQNEKNIERKTKKDEPEDKTETASGSEVSRKRKALKDESKLIQAKKPLVEKKNPKLPNEATFAQNKEKAKRSTEVKLRSHSLNRKKIIPSKDPPKLSDRPLYVKRSARMSDSENRVKHIGKDTEKKILRSKTQSKSIEIDSKKIQKSRIEVRKRHSNSRDRSGIISKLKANENVKTVEKKIKEKATGKSINFGVGKKSSLNSAPKEGTKALAKVNNVGKDSKRISSITEKENSNSKKNLETKSDVGKKIQKTCSEVFDDGEELLEKICDLLEEAGGVPETGRGEIRNGAQKFYLSHQGTIFSSNERRLLIPDAYFFKPRIVNKNVRFPSQGKGTVSYKKLWKWSHYVKMPSDMWSLHKHPNGSFVIVFHVSEQSPFPKLIIDKCILFKETASPCVKIYGKDVLALSSDKELQTLGNVCSFLKQIHDISLCVGMLSPLGGGSNNNCELYTDGKVSLPYKCKSCL